AAPEASALHESMRTLNRAASEAALALGATCATDITGFGLLGHASHIARASGVTIRIRASQVPTLPGARDAAERGVKTGGADRNAAWLDALVDWGTASATDRALLIDPQTSGGMLVALRPEQVASYISRVPGAVEIGDVIAAGPKGLVLA
ncbi:MAG TPA: AIR synthase-related protein, partial [Gemmatimonadaceae bacterium]|nr:AIR synthase-related protein [Gemmatimonadaceae bacterium]